MINERTIQWIFASVAKYFDTNKGSYILVVDGDQLDLNDIDFWTELYIANYSSTHQSRDRYLYDFEITLVVTESPIGDEAYKIHRAIGYFASLFGTIPIYKYGSTADFESDSSQLGCAVVQNPINIQHFGTREPGSSISQSTVSARFQMTLQGEP